MVWQRGLLKKGIGLCHGIPGNGYAFLAAHRATSATSGQQFYEQALSFGIFAVQVRHAPDAFHPSSIPAVVRSQLAPQETATCRSSKSC